MDTKIGDNVWIFDINSRSYVDDLGNRTTSPVWLHHWRKCKIIGETSRSWVLDYFDKKVPKKYDYRDGVCFSWEQLLERAWTHEHRYKIESALKGISPEKLREVATLIGYKG